MDPENKSSRKAFAFGTIGVMAAIVLCAAAMLTNRGGQVQTFGTSPASYSCSSVHFGMDDLTLKGDANLANSDVLSVGEHEGSMGVVSGITMTGYEVVNQAVNAHENAGLKLSSGKKNSTVIITFASNLVACDVYAVGWKGDSAALSVNGSDPVAIASNDSITGTSLVEGVQYSKYHFDFDETNVVTFAATKRLVIGDIALRIKG